MTVFIDEDLHKYVKSLADKKYSKPSAYKSGWIVKTYKEMGGKFENDEKGKPLKRWFSEKWISVVDENKYPVYRPTIRISEETPLTIDEIKPSNMKKQIILKQKIRGKSNLPPFVPK